MTRPLFRQLALNHQHQKGLGEVIFAVSPNVLFLGAVATVIACAVLAFICWGEFTRKAHVEGYLLPDKGMIKIFTQSAGRVLEKRVSEGQVVKRGDVLIVVSTERGSLDVAQVNAETVKLLKKRRNSLKGELKDQASLDVLRSQKLEQNIDSLTKELKELQAGLETQQKRLTSAEHVAARYTALEMKRFVSTTQAQEYENSVLDQQGRLQDLQRDHIVIKSQLSTLELDRKSSELASKKSISQIERQINLIEQDLAEYESYRQSVITAPVDGVVTAILVKQGQQASPQMPLLSLIPEGSVFEAQLLVPSRAIGFVELGQVIVLRYQAFPFQRFGHYNGKIKEISKALLNPIEANLPIPLQEPVYLVTASLEQQAISAYGRELPLQSGMLLDAGIKLDKRTILEWILDPIFSLIKTG